MVNQLRNHLVRGYGQVALQVDREELFHVQPLYAVTRELCELLARLVPERRQLGAQSPIPLHRLRADDLVQAPPAPLLNQIASWIEAVPASERLLVEPRAEANRLFLEILYGTADLLDFLLNHDSSPLRGLGGRVLLAGEADKAIRAEIQQDRSPLRVELRRDFEQIDNLTGLHSKNEYLRLAPILFRQEKLAGRELALLLADRSFSCRKRIGARRRYSFLLCSPVRLSICSKSRRSSTRSGERCPAGLARMALSASPASGAPAPPPSPQESWLSRKSRRSAVPYRISRNRRLASARGSTKRHTPAAPAGDLVEQRHRRSMCTRSSARRRCRGGWGSGPPSVRPARAPAWPAARTVPGHAYRCGTWKSSSRPAAPPPSSRAPGGCAAGSSSPRPFAPPRPRKR